MELQEQRQGNTAVVEAVSDRQLSEVKGMVYMAKQFPRDENRAIQRILKSCERASLAERATYEYPRGGTKVTGPSIRLAEAIAQHWGNIDFGIVELEQKDGESTVMAYAWDLESNTRQTKIFNVAHVRERRRGSVKLTEPRDIYELVANMGARRLRACILGVVPGDVVDLAVEKCEEVLSGNLGDNLGDVINKMISAFKKEYGVTQKQLEDLVGCKASAFSPNDITRLRGVFGSLRDGMASVEDHFGGSSKKEADKSPFDDTDDLPEGLK
ncbi:MAG TPA: hypothetical protein GXX72_00980 [Clostridiaceae bacterium]|nr:hypothetical protein [Clostridiaceae bacterium]